MTLGRDNAVGATTRAVGVYRRLFGSEDWHGHFRWHAIRDYIDPFAATTLEVGCGEGLMTIAVARINPNRIMGSDMDGAGVERARRVAAHLGLDHRVSFVEDDAAQLSTGGPFDQVLAIDVLEHIPDDQEALKQIAEAMTPNGRLVVSVPTPRFPDRFGRDYADHLGHVRDGYWLEDLEPKLRAAGLEVRAHHYYAGPAVAGLNVLNGASQLRALLMPVLRPVFKATERRVPRDRACGLALLAVRTASAGAG